MYVYIYSFVDDRARHFILPFFVRFLSVKCFVLFCFFVRFCVFKKSNLGVTLTEQQRKHVFISVAKHNDQPWHQPYFLFSRAGADVLWLLLKMHIFQRPAHTPLILHYTLRRYFKGKVPKPSHFVSFGGFFFTGFCKVWPQWYFIDFFKPGFSF